MKKYLPYLGFLLLIPSLILNLIFYQKEEKDKVKVLSVIDGDTVVLKNKNRLRLREIDAPEENYCGGKEAKDLLKKLVEGKKVKIEEMIPDQQGRGMAYISVGNLNVNLEMMKSGWVRYHHDQTNYTEIMKKIDQEVKGKGLGIYGKCWQKENLDNPQCVIKGNIDEKGRKLYYSPGCAQYKFVVVEKDIGEEWFCSEEEAQKAGFSRAATCK